jgi:uncharacterized protein YecT (DUF1311 family)
MFAKSGIAVLALVLAGGAARADVATGLGLFGCASTRTDAALTACAKVDFDQAESDLRDAFAAALLRMHAIDQEQPVDKQRAAAALQAAEAAWVAYRDDGCSAEGMAMPTDASRIPAVLACKARLTASRSQELWVLSGGP